MMSPLHLFRILTFESAQSPHKGDRILLKFLPPQNLRIFSETVDLLDIYINKEPREDPNKKGNPCAVIEVYDGRDYCEVWLDERSAFGLAAIYCVKYISAHDATVREDLANLWLRARSVVAEIQDRKSDQGVSRKNLLITDYGLRQLKEYGRNILQMGG